MRPASVPMPIGVPTARRTTRSLPFRASRETAKSGRSVERYYRRIRRDLEPFFRRLGEPFKGRE